MASNKTENPDGLEIVDKSKGDNVAPEPVIEKKDNGDLDFRVAPEDWNFSREAQALGAKVYATRKIALIHIGSHEYRAKNVADWKPASYCVRSAKSAVKLRSAAA